MSGNQITQTSQRGLEPINSKLESQHAHLQNALREKLGVDHARLLAEPVRVSAAFIAWFTEHQGGATQLAQLSAVEQTELSGKLQRLLDDITKYCKELERQGDSGRDLARLLSEALIVPSPESVWSVGGSPVLVDWGRRRADAGASPQDVTALLGTGMRVTEPGAPAAQPNRHEAPETANTAALRPAGLNRMLALALWALFVLIVLLIAERLLAACGLGPAWPSPLRAWFSNNCVVATQAPSTLVEAERAMRAAEREFALRMAACANSCPIPPAPEPQTAPPIVPAPPPGTNQTDRQSIDRALETHRAERGKFEITLSWRSSADLDLAVVCPSGQTIDFRQQANCGGRLVLDMNAGSVSQAQNPVEHIIWDTPPAPNTQFRVVANYYSRRNAPQAAAPYSILVRLNNDVVHEHAGVLTGPGDTKSFDVRVPPNR
jgi:hypothetical protein